MLEFNLKEERAAKAI
jgi:coiled-coil domain-containing protein 78